MKRILMLMLIFTLLLSLTACQSKNDLGGPSISEQDANETTSSDPSSSEIISNETASTSSESESQDSSSSEANTEPFIFDDFPLKKLDGTMTSLYEQGDQIILLNFWATWCKYCEKEMPLLNELSKNEKYHVMAIDVGESAETVQKYLDDNGYDLDVYLDENNELASQFGVTGFPTTIFISSNFEYLYSYPGMLDDETLNSILKAIDDYNSK